MESFYGGRQGQSIEINHTFDDYSLEADTIIKQRLVVCNSTGTPVMEDGDYQYVEDGNYEDAIYTTYIDDPDGVMLSEGMIECFNQGVASLSIVPRGGYCLIDTKTNRGGYTGQYHGNIYQRGYDDEPILIGQIRGQDGTGISTIEKNTISTPNNNGEVDILTITTRDGEHKTPVTHSYNIPYLMEVKVITQKDLQNQLVDQGMAGDLLLLFSDRVQEPQEYDTTAYSAYQNKMIKGWQNYGNISGGATTWSIIREITNTDTVPVLQDILEGGQYYEIPPEEIESNISMVGRGYSYDNPETGMKELYFFGYGAGTAQNQGHWYFGGNIGAVGFDVKSVIRTSDDEDDEKSLLPFSLILLFTERQHI